MDSKDKKEEKLKKENVIKVAENDLRKYQDKSAVENVLGCLLKNPQLLKNYKLLKEDFIEKFHLLIFGSIVNMARSGAKEITSYMVEQYIKKFFPDKISIFINHDGAKYIKNALYYANIKNFERDYEMVRKYTLLRKLFSMGIDVSEYENPNELDAEMIGFRRRKLEKETTDEIINHYKKKVVSLIKDFTTITGRDSVKAGSEAAKLQKEAWKESINYGVSYASNFLTTVTYGIRKKRYSVYSAGTGTGKTRISIANLCHSFVPKYWDAKKGEWVKNPNGVNNRALYIGTEMELIEEIEPIIWAYMANVKEEHITLNKYEPGEEERVDEAIRILNEEGNIYLEYVPDYNVALLESIIEEHVSEHQITSVFFDYIFNTPSLDSEYQSKAKMAIREDQVLGNLSSRLKDITRKFNVSLDTCTQITGDYINNKVRDQTLVRGSKAIIDKCDIAGIITNPTTTELEHVRGYVSKLGFNNKEPNVCFSIYKNRGGTANKIKIWLYIDYDTMRVNDLFVTNMNDELIENFKQSFVYITEDSETHVFNEKDELEEFVEQAATDSMIVDIEDDDDDNDKNKNENKTDNVSEDESEESFVEKVYQESVISEIDNNDDDDDDDDIIISEYEDEYEDDEMNNVLEEESEDFVY